MTDFSQAEEFRADEGLARGSLLLTVLFLGIPLVGLTWLIARGLLSLLGVPAASLVALLVALGFLAAVTALRGRQLARSTQQLWLRVDQQGITQRDPRATRHVAWHDLVAVTSVTPLVGLSAGQVADIGVREGSKTKGVDALARAAAGQQLGLLGRGTLTLDDGVNVAIRTQYQQNAPLNGVDPATGVPYVPLFPAQFQPQWTEDRIGAWVRHHRPDLFATAD